MKMFIGTIILLSAALSGCSTAGPFVTNISSDGANGLTVEKCMIHLNGWTGALENSNCTNVNLKLTSTSSSTK
jgi:hypothetical protein